MGTSGYLLIAIAIISAAIRSASGLLAVGPTCASFSPVTPRSLSAGGAFSRTLGLGLRPSPTWPCCSSYRAAEGSVEQDEGETEEENVKNFLRLQAAELGSQLRGTNLYFVGMMGTGKSTVARGLADVMGRYSFLDTDTIIEELLGAPVSQIFEEDGEEAFRSVEGQVLDQVHSYVKMCVATGGGIVCRQENWGKLQTGLVVWLDMDVEDIVHRLRADEAEVAKRPLLKGGDDAGAKLAAILEDRRSLYELADVHVRIDRDDDVDAAVVSTIEAIQTFIDNNPPKWRQWKEQAKASGMDWV